MAESTHAKIGVATATIIGMNAMIGSGIFTAPAAMASNVGPAGILAYIFVVVAVWFMALSLARLAELYPQEGSFYVYAKPWSGHIGGLIASASYFAGLLIAMGALSQLAGFYLIDFFPPSYSPYNLGLMALITLVILNMFGMVLSQLGQYFLIIFTVIPLVATTIACFSQINLNNFIPFAPHGIANVLKATRVVIFGFFGFECAMSLSNIVENPKKNVPRALTHAIVLVGIIYTFFIASIILSAPPSVFTGPHVRVSEVIKVLFPHAPWFALIIHSTILLAVLGTIHSMIWTSSNLLTLLVKRLKSKPAHYLVNTGLINQKVAVLIVGTCILISYTSITNIDLFFFLTAFFIIFCFIMSMITLLTLKKEWQSGQNIKTVIGMLTALLIFTFAVEGIVLELIKPAAQSTPLSVEIEEQKEATQDLTFPD